MKSLILLTLLAAGVAVKSPRLKFVLQGKSGCYVFFYFFLSIFSQMVAIVTDAARLLCSCHAGKIETNERKK